MVGIGGKCLGSAAATVAAATTSFVRELAGYVPGKGNERVSSCYRPRVNLSWERWFFRYMLELKIGRRTSCIQVITRSVLRSQSIPVEETLTLEGNWCTLRLRFFFLIPRSGVLERVSWLLLYSTSVGWFCPSFLCGQAGRKGNGGGDRRDMSRQFVVESGSYTCISIDVRCYFCPCFLYIVVVVIQSVLFYIEHWTWVVVSWGVGKFVIFVWIALNDLDNLLQRRATVYGLRVGYV